MRKTIPLAVSLAGLLMVVGCSSSPTGPSTSFTGTGIDGVINGATVCIDVNDNNKCDITNDPKEPNTKTDVYGKFTLDSTGVTGKLILTGGKDMGTGLLFTGSLKAPAGSTVVTPLTSAVQALVESGSTVDKAEKTIKTALGITSVEKSLMDFDPFVAIEDNATQESAQKVLAATAQLQTIIHAVSATVASADKTISIADAMSHAMDSIASSLEKAVKIAEAAEDTNVTIDKDMVAKAIKDVANELYKEVEGENKTEQKERLSALVAVKIVADNVATEALTYANIAKEKVENADFTLDGKTNLTEVESLFNSGIYVANVSMQESVEDSSTKVLNTIVESALEDIIDLDTAQIEQEVAEENLINQKLILAEAIFNNDSATIKTANQNLSNIEEDVTTAATAITTASSKVEVAVEEVIIADIEHTANKAIINAQTVTDSAAIQANLEEEIETALDEVAKAEAEAEAKANCIKANGTMENGTCVLSIGTGLLSGSGTDF